MILLRVAPVAAPGREIVPVAEAQRRHSSWHRVTVPRWRGGTIPRRSGSGWRCWSSSRSRSLSSSVSRKSRQAPIRSCGRIGGPASSSS